MKKIISLFLSFMLISQVSLFAYKDMTTEDVSNYCKFSHNKKECSYYNNFGKQVNDSWNKYDHSIFNYQETEYYKLSPYELYEKYREVSSDIDYL